MNIENKQRNAKFVNIVVLLILGILSTVFLTCAFWLLYPYKTADIVEPIKILNENRQIRPNERIKMELKVTKYNLYPVTTANSILCSNGRLYVIASIQPKGTNILPVGSFTRIQDSYSLPGDAQIGTTCHFIFYNEYKVNPIRVVPLDWISETFEVIE